MARILVVGLLAAVAVVVVPVVLFGPPTWVPDALVPSFLERTGPTVALVPGPGSPLGTGSPVVAEQATGAVELPVEVVAPDVALTALTVGDDRWAEMAYVSVAADPSVVVDDSVEPVQGIVPLEAGPWTGITGIDEQAGHRWLSVETGSGHLTAWSGRETAVASLQGLVAGIDPGVDLTRQKLAGGWRVVATKATDLDGSTMRRIGYGLSEPDGYLEVTTRLGVGPNALWLVGNATVADRVEVRGRQGLVTGFESESSITLTWEEEAGMVMHLTVVADDDDLLTHALRLANDLRPVDQAGWEDLALDAAQSAQVTVPPPDEVDDPPLVILAGVLADGRSFRIEERSGAALCVVIDGAHPLDRCDERPGRNREGSRAALPRLVDPGDVLVEDRQPLLVYGYLPERRLQGDWGRVQDSLGEAVPVGQAVSVHVTDTRERSYGLATIVGGVWAMHIDQVTLGLVVTYTFPDGTTLVVEPDPGEDPDGEG